MTTIKGNRNLGIGISDSSGSDEGTTVQTRGGSKKKGSRAKFPKKSGVPKNKTAKGRK